MPVAVHGAVGAKNMIRRKKEKQQRKDQAGQFDISLGLVDDEGKVGHALSKLELKSRHRIYTDSIYKDPDRYESKIVVAYLRAAQWCEVITVGDQFNAFIIFVIIIAGVLVGLQTYPPFVDDPYVQLVDVIVLVIFGIEVVAKIVAEGLAPWRYFTGREWKWNNFDFVIVIMCLPIWGDTFGGGGNSVALLRLVRLMRLMKLVRKIPQLQMIVMGLIGGMKSIGYIMALLFLVFYLYGVLGVYIFRDNDPFHFQDLFTALNTLFRISTLEDWTDVLYINYYGCDSQSFPSGIYKEPEDPNTLFIACNPDKATGAPDVAVVYFITFVIVSALVMLSLFVGAVTMSMTESMEQMKQEAEESEKRKRLVKAKKRAEEQRRREIEEGDYSDSDSEQEDEDEHSRSENETQGTPRILGVEGESLKDCAPANLNLETSSKDPHSAKSGKDSVLAGPNSKSGRDSIVAGLLAEAEEERSGSKRSEIPRISKRQSVQEQKVLQEAMAHVTVPGETRGEQGDATLNRDEGEEPDPLAQLLHAESEMELEQSAADGSAAGQEGAKDNLLENSNTQEAAGMKSEERSRRPKPRILPVKDDTDDATDSRPGSPKRGPVQILRQVSRHVGLGLNIDESPTVEKGGSNIFQRLQQSFGVTSPNGTQQHQREFDSHEKLLLHHENSKFGDPNTKRRIKHFMATAWQGVDLLDLIDDVEEQTYRKQWMRSWLVLSRECAKVTEDPRFVNIITMIIVVAGLQVGAQTFESMNEGVMGEVLGVTDQLIIGTFIVEVILKTVAKEFKPWHYFYDSRSGFQGWNTFDYLVVAGSFLPDGEMITMLRLLRLLRVLKLVKSLPELQIIVVALIGGISSISYIGVIMFMVFYVFAILGMLLFSRNDPWHFGSLHVSLMTLFRCATLEDWSDVMYINIYGCDRHGYFEMEDQCTSPEALYTIAAMYFVIFTVIGALVLMTLFIGVVTTSMEEATAAQQEQMELQARVRAVQEKFGLDDRTISKYEQVFHILDLDGGGTIEEEELRIGLQSIGQVPSSKQLRCMLKAVDADDSGEVDIAEFVLFMCLLKEGKFEGEGMVMPDFIKLPEMQPRKRTSIMGSINNFRQSTRRLIFGSEGVPRTYFRGSVGSRTSSKVLPELGVARTLSMAEEEPATSESNNSTEHSAAQREDNADEQPEHKVKPVKGLSFLPSSAPVDVEAAVSHLSPLTSVTLPVEELELPKGTSKALEQTKRRASLSRSMTNERKGTAYKVGSSDEDATEV